MSDTFSMLNFCLRNGTTPVNLFGFRALTTKEKLKEDKRTQGANSMQAMSVEHDTARGCISTLLRSMGWGRGLYPTVVRPTMFFG